MTCPSSTSSSSGCGKERNKAAAELLQRYSSSQSSGPFSNRSGHGCLSSNHILSSNYLWADPAISNNGVTAQAIQSTFQELELITNVTVGYSYATLVQPLDTTTFGRTMDATGSAVIPTYLNIPGRGGQLSTTWRDASDGAINPAFKFTVNQWMSH
jgi:hypothetical protein